ncbi:MAG: hypothetical protein LBQ60_04130 [Bacteroidales bacterium]|jgi:hypothetical protein|nr:hypothetical protein [Bacteroidales bacterium]
MKKISYLLLILFLGITACEGPTGPMGPAGPPGDDAGATQWWNIPIEIDRNGWELVGNAGETGSYYIAIVDIPELTEDIYFDGAIICYYRFNEGNTEVLTTLPYTYYDIIDDNGTESRVAVQYSYDVTPTTKAGNGTIALKLTFSDFQTGEFGPPEKAVFRLSLIY